MAKWAKEIVALLRALKVCYYELAGKPLIVYTQYSAAKWIFTDKQNRTEYLHWAVQLAPWSITFRACRAKCPPQLKPVAITVPTAPGRAGEHGTVAGPLHAKSREGCGGGLRHPTSNVWGQKDELYVATFDGAIKRIERVGSYGASIWKLPNWDLVWAAQGVVTDATVNTAEYQGLLEVLMTASRLKLTRLRIFGDSKIVVHQVNRWMQCKQPHLQELCREAQGWIKRLEDSELHHVLRVWNGSADHLASRALRLRLTEQVTNPAELLAVQLKNKLPELVQQKCQGVSHDTITEIVFESLRHICSQIEWDTEGGECASTMTTSSATDMLACLEPASSAQTIKGGGGSVFLAQDKTTTAEDNQGTRKPASSAQTIKGGGSSVFLAQDKATTAEDNPGDPEHPASSGDPGDPDGQNFATKAKNSPYHPGNPGKDGQGNPADDPALIMQRDIFVAIIRDNMEALHRERLRVISEAQGEEI
ncbi:hypothetical protein H257_18607 [Aphanomyces astaci]|uniref:RNase H type-1 domain-containing protein n=1 Tax=Aphanomyces astaci TaxID=112090 RepID=W4FC68_APHAT|nr:hypothetical protein H257_18607 [Aphanomyces astaci]ETV64514.1 hypothetical protein H257_18607 [Aphanomyces astaci]|eukprot:XP_009846004.1 hypothetical protein H257_18607 [Aphanomyces astaci]